jgi:hypothetical protein
MNDVWPEAPENISERQHRIRIRNLKHTLKRRLGSVAGVVGRIVSVDWSRRAGEKSRIVPASPEAFSQNM